MKKSKALFFIAALVAVIASISLASATTFIDAADDGEATEESFGDADISSIPEGELLNNILAIAGNNVTAGDFTSVTIENSDYTFDSEILAKISADVVAKNSTKAGATAIVRPKKIIVTSPGYVALIATRGLSEAIKWRVPYLVNISTKEICRARALGSSGIPFQTADDLDVAYVVSTARLEAGDYAMYSAIPQTYSDEDDNTNTSTDSSGAGCNAGFVAIAALAALALIKKSR